MAQRKDKSQAMREKILNTATQLFIQKGSEKTSMQDIAQTAGISKGAIYHHFKSKDEIVLGVMRSRQELMEEEMKQWAANLYIATDDGSYGIKGNVSVVINEFDTEFDAIYSCGAPGMMKYINQTFYDHPRAYLSLESRMACGMGACYACVVHVAGQDESVNKRVCEDGPVFETGTIIV